MSDLEQIVEYARDSNVPDSTWAISPDENLSTPDTLEPKQSSPNREKASDKKRKPSRKINGHAVEHHRTAYLYPFLGDGSGYRHLMMQADERVFWNEIEHLVEEHRPQQIADLVKRKYSRGGKRYDWDTVHEKIKIRASNSPYVILSPKKQDAFIKTNLIERLNGEIGQISDLFKNYRTSGFLWVEERDDEKLYYRSIKMGRGHSVEYGWKRGGQPVYHKVADPIRGLPARLKDRDYGFGIPAHLPKLRRIFVDIGREREKVAYVESRLQELGPSCEALLIASTAMFAVEYNIQYRTAEVSRLEDQLATEELSKTRRKKLAKQRDDLVRILKKDEESRKELENKTDDYLSRQVTKQEKTPREIIIDSYRRNKRPLPNKEYLSALENLRKLAENYLFSGQFLEAMTLNNALHYLGMHYELTLNGGRPALVQSPNSGANGRDYVGLVVSDEAYAEFARYFLIADADFNWYIRMSIKGEKHEIPKAGEIAKNEVMTLSAMETPLEMRVWRDNNNLLFAAVCVPEYSGLSGLNDEDSILKLASHGFGAHVPMRYHNYRGDIVLLPSQLDGILKNIQMPQLTPYIARNDGSETIRFKEDDSLRIELYKERIDGRDFYRAQFFGVPLPDLKKPHDKKLTFSEIVSTALYRPKAQQ